MASFTESLFGPTLVSKTGEVPATTALADCDAVGIYFSAHWCPPCRGFTPKLGQIYSQLKAAGKKTEFVFVSSDRDQSAFDGYHAEMPFLALPYSQRDLKTELSNKLYVFHPLVSFLFFSFLHSTRRHTTDNVFLSSFFFLLYHHHHQPHPTVASPAFPPWSSSMARRVISLQRMDVQQSLHPILLKISHIILNQHTT